MSLPVRGDGAADARDPTRPAHLHAWADLRFELADGHPWVLETCSACGQQRRYRAFERFWDPAAPPAAEADQPMGRAAPR